MDYDFKLYLDQELSSPFPPDNKIKAGIYKVLGTNETYDDEPSTASINIFVPFGSGMREISIEVPVARYNWGMNSGIVYGQLVWNSFEEKFLTDVDSMTSEKIMENLEGLRPAQYSINEFIKEFAGGDEKEALKIAIRQDWDAIPIPKKRMYQIFIKAMQNR